jgi:hydrogenase nickel incorporation protein HypB
VDLLPYIDCNIETLAANALKINPSLTVFRMSARTGEGIDSWCDWLEQRALQHGKSD